MKILLIEDNPDEAIVLQGLIAAARPPMTVQWTDRLAAGLEHLTAHSYDLILLDLNLNDSQGLDTFRRLHRQVPHIPIVILTGNADDEESIAAVQEGAQDYLLKSSIHTELLNRSIRYAIERHRNETALLQARQELERRVAERTADLVKANATLKEEIAERMRAEISLQERNEKLAQLYQEVEAARRQLQRLSQRLVAVQEEERRNIARELHDQIGQMLTGLKTSLDLAKFSASKTIGESLEQAQQQTNELLQRVRNLSLDLRPAMLDDLGLLPALLWLFDRYTAQTQVKVNFKQTGIDRRFSPELETTIYRIVQEALTNVARHSHADQANIFLWTSANSISLQIEDAGVGFVPEEVLAGRHSSGLTGMQERALLLLGKLTIESSPGAGTCLAAEFPSPESPSHES